MSKILITIALLLALSVSAKKLYSENFEKGFSSKYKNVKVVSGGPTGSRKCLQIEHKPSSKGSDRISIKEDIKPSREVTLTYLVRFDSKFEFVKGGKLPGLLGGPNKAVGCVKQPKDSWSVRVMWRREGVATLYIYHQDRKERCGMDYPSSYKFSRGRWHRVQVYVKVNSKKSKSDGYAKLVINGKTVRTVSKIKFRATDSSKALATEFYLSNFYGGADKSWAPKRTTKIQFDNIRVESGRKV